MTFQIFIFKSNYNKTKIINIDDNISVKTLYEKVSDKLNIPLKYFYLTYSGKIIYYNDLTINHYNISSGSTIHLYIKRPDTLRYAKEKEDNDNTRETSL